MCLFSFSIFVGVGGVVVVAAAQIGVVGIDPNELTNSTVRSGIESSIANSANITTGTVVVDGAHTNSSSANGGNSTNISYHVVANNTNGDAQNTAQSLNNVTQSNLSVTLTANLGRIIIVVQIPPVTIEVQRDTRPLNVTAAFFSNNAKSSSVAGPGTSIMLSVMNTTKPLARISVIVFFVSGVVRPFTYQVDSAGIRTGLQYVVQESDSSGYAYAQVEWTDQSGIKQLCDTGEENPSCIRGLVHVDVSAPQVALSTSKEQPSASDWSSKTHALRVQNSEFAFSKSFDRTMMVEFEADEFIGAFDFFQFSVHCTSADCEATLRAVAGPDEPSSQGTKLYLWIEISTDDNDQKDISIEFSGGAIVDLAGNPSASLSTETMFHKVEPLNQCVVAIVTLHSLTHVRLFQNF
jgi:hypothetical protein